MNQINIPLKLKTLNSNVEVGTELIDFVNRHNFSKIAFFTSKTPNELLTNSLEIALFNHVDVLKTFQVISLSISFIDQMPLYDFDLVVGIGGGKVIDTAKYAACRNSLPFVSIPTAISNDGICSPISVLKDESGKYHSVGTRMPVALLVPLHLVRNENDESFLSGIGDLLSNLSAIEDWQLASKETGEQIDDYAVMMARNSALCVYLEIKNSILNKKSKEDFLNDNLHSVVEALALSGIAMEISGNSRPASGGEHLISHSLDELYGGVKPHGIQVAFGMLITTFLRGELGYISKENFSELKQIFEYIGLPTTLKRMGITKDQLINAIKHAPLSRPGRFTILNKIKMDDKYLEKMIDAIFDYSVAV